MVTKEQLLAYRPMRKEAQDIERRLRHLERQPESDRAVLEPLRALYLKKLAELVDAQVRIENAISKLSTVERSLIRYRYIDGLEWHQVCGRLHYEWTHTHRIHARALDRLRNI